MHKARGKELVIWKDGGDESCGGDVHSGGGIILYDKEVVRGVAMSDDTVCLY